MMAVRLLAIVAILTVPAVAAAADIDVRTSVSQTALWVGTPVTYVVTLTCRPDVDVLQEDLGADKLTLEGLQVVGHTIDRQVMSDSRTRYVIAYQLATFEPTSETLAVRDWTVRYAAGPQAAGKTATAQELTIPGVALAWRSALPGALNTLDLRPGGAGAATPRSWRITRVAALVLMGVSVAAFATLAVRRVTAGRPRRTARRVKKGSPRDLINALTALADNDVTDAGRRRAAYDALDATLRQHVADVTDVPATALTPRELAERLAHVSSPLQADAVVRVLEDCERARYQRAGQLPDAPAFAATLEAAREAVTQAR